MDFLKRRLIFIVIAVIVMIIISVVQSNTPYTCYMCRQTKTGARHKVQVSGVSKDFCPSCYSLQKSLGNIKSY